MKIRFVGYILKLKSPKNLIEEGKAQDLRSSGCNLLLMAAICRQHGRSVGDPRSGAVDAAGVPVARRLFLERKARVERAEACRGEAGAEGRAADPRPGARGGWGGGRAEASPDRFGRLSSVGPI